MNNKQQAENFLDLAKGTFGESESLAKWRLELAKVHALLALEEAVRSLDNGS